MKAVRFYFLVNVFLTGCVQMSKCDLLTTVFSFTGYDYFYEVCNSRWIAFNEAGLRADLDKKLFGQHIASRVIMNGVKNFLKDDNPAKPLVLSLHGPSGTGKNFVCQLIAKNLYKNGMDSEFVHLFSSTHHFPHKSEIDIYKAWLQQQIQSSVSNCERSMFIFDETDKMPHELIDSIKPYLEYYNKLDGVSYRKAIFIFLSNEGGNAIAETALEFLRKGQNRNEIGLKDLEHVIFTAEFNSNTGLKPSLLIGENVVDFFIPFLPLEYSHVIQCVMALMEARGLRPDPTVAGELATDLTYYPKIEKKFSSIGCKTIDKRLNYYL